MKAASASFFLLSITSVALANTAPEVVIQSAAMRPDSTLMDVVYRVNDPDNATVKTRALAFVDGVRSFANVIRPVTFLDGTDANLGDAIAANVDHTLTWDVGADWDIDLGQIKFEVLAMDGRGLLPFDWITIPEAGGHPEVTVSQNSPAADEVLNAMFWQHADGDLDLSLVDGLLSGTASSGAFNQVALVDGNVPQAYAIPFIFKRMNLDPDDGVVATAARAGLSNPNGWHAANRPYSGVKILSGWGDNDYGQASPPEELSYVTTMAAGGSHSLALLGNGRVVGWGDDSIYGIATPPEGLSNVTAIAAGRSHSLALLGNGTVVGWGRDDIGQATPPEGLSNVTAITAGVAHNLAILDNGTIEGWGSNAYGQATPPEGLSNVTAIAAGVSHSLALLDNGTVVGWGRNNYGQATPPEGLSNVTAIAAAGLHSLALLGNGTVVCWGYNHYGQATPPEGLSNVTAIAAGGSHSLALQGNGMVVGWGYNGPPPEGLSNVTVIAAGVYHSLALEAKAP